MFISRATMELKRLTHLPRQNSEDSHQANKNRARGSLPTAVRAMRSSFYIDDLLTMLTVGGLGCVLGCGVWRTLEADLKNPGTMMKVPFDGSFRGMLSESGLFERALLQAGCPSYGLFKGQR
jgi:hypothetical protein